MVDTWVCDGLPITLGSHLRVREIMVNFTYGINLIIYFSFQLLIEGVNSVTS